MSYILDEDTSNFTVKIKNIKMEYPITAALIKSCPLLASKIGIIGYSILIFLSLIVNVEGFSSNVYDIVN